MGCLEGSGVPVLYIGHMVPKRLITWPLKMMHTLCEEFRDKNYQSSGICSSLFHPNTYNNYEHKTNTGI